MPALFDKGFQIVVAGGVEQAETGEVALGPELLGSGSKEEDGGNPLSQAFHDLVGSAGELGCPFEVVGLVDNQEIPLGIEHLSVAVGRGSQIIETDADDLTVEKGIGIGVGSFDGLAAFLIKQTGDQVEPAEQFDKPLVHQGLRQNDQGTLGPAGQDAGGEE